MTIMDPERPREKLARRGPEALTDMELVCVILGVSPVRAASIVKEGGGRGREGALEEYAKRRRAFDPRPVVDGARTAVGLVSAEVRCARKEHFLVLCLNARRQLLRVETVSVGTLSASLVHPREVFSPAIENGAAAVVAVHNHPSGDTSPSAEDREATRRLQRAGELLGIPLADHVIVSESSFFSFRESGLL
ncbi:MAG: DNA repair protein RadC [Elusimicrobiota bacterium]